MNKTKMLLPAISLLLSSTCAFAQTTLIKNIQGYTLEENNLRQFSAIKFTDDKIDKLFAKNESYPENTDWKIINGNGATLLPGLIDAHGHVLSYGQSLLNADLVGTRSEQEAVQRTLAYAKQNSAEQNTAVSWITGRGWNQVQWPSNTYPSAATLDQFFPDTPVWLERIDAHAGWANSKAMALAGITEHTQAPTGGKIIRNSQGQPTGVFVDNAMALITNSIAKPTLAQQKAILLTAMHSLASLGLTSVHDAGIDSENLQAFSQLSKENKMPIRINAMLYLPSNNWQQTLAKGSFHSADNMLNFNSVKIQADGALGSRGAAMIADYSDHAGHKGLLLHDEKSLKHYINTAMKAGFQVNTHAIGDNANKIVLDVYQELIKTTGTKALRHRVEHAQILRLQDIPRFNQLGVIASMQATHATSDKNMAVDRIGNSRILGAYAWRKLLNANAIIAAGSDFPVESANPFLGLHASITRQDQHNVPEHGWFGEEKMTRIEALKSFTLDAAYSGHQEQLIGSLSAGKKADFILLQDDLFNIKETDIWKNKVLQTWVNGVQVYQKNH